MSGENWAILPCVSFDVETTGVNAFEDRIVQAALVTIHPDPWMAGAPPTIEQRTWLVDPHVEIPDEAAAIHGMTTEWVAANATHLVTTMLEEVTAALAEAMAQRWAVVVMNAPFDLTMLEAENDRYGVVGLGDRVNPMPIGPIVDPFVLDKAVDPYRKGSRKLVDTCAHYGVPLDGAHDAGADALAAGLLWPEIIRAFPGKFRGLTLGGLHMAQVGWRREQMNSLRAYFDREGTPHDGCPTGWPILSKPVETAELQGSLL